jgi:endonuclease/exonuclease/phosphatase family metal-dependent hydrolase
VDAKQGISGCSGGILFASKIPIQYVDHIVYKHVSGVDALAEKGCVLVAGELDGHKFQIAGTHLQAGDPAMNAKEVDEIFAGIIKPHRTPGVPQILTGDMNIAKGTDRYQALLATNEMSDFPLDDPSPYTTDGNNSWNKKGKQPAHIDHVLLNPRGTGTTITRQTVQRARRDHEGQPMDLADHYGVVADVQLK